MKKTVEDCGVIFSSLLYVQMESHIAKRERKGKKKRKLKKDRSNLLKCARESPLY